MRGKSSSGNESRSLLAYGFGAFLVVLVGVVIAVPMLIGTKVLSGGSSECESSTSEGTPEFTGGGIGEWLATSYGPPWAEGNGTGVTATGIDLRPDKHAYIIAVDPLVIPLGSYVHISPNPFNNNALTFQAADTGGAIIGKHIDIYDWRGRAYQDGWGERKVKVIPAPSTGAGNLLGATEAESTTVGCSTVGESGPLPLTPGQTAKILHNGNAAAPSEIPGKAGKIVKAIIAAGNEIDHTSYVYGGGHGTLTHLYSGYDCSSSTSYLLYKAGLHSATAQTSGELEQWGEQGPGKYLTIYANSGHVFLEIAGIVFNTAWYAQVPEPAILPDPPSTGPRWQHGSTLPRQLAGDEFGGFVVRHWPGL